VSFSDTPRLIARTAGCYEAAEGEWAEVKAFLADAVPEGWVERVTERLTADIRPPFGLRELPSSDAMKAGHGDPPKAEQVMAP
jgi:hypothetical protein